MSAVKLLFPLDFTPAEGPRKIPTAYRGIVDTWERVRQSLAETPRMDMPGGQPPWDGNGYCSRQAVPCERRCG